MRAGAVVTHLYAKEPKAAWRLFQDALLIDCFVASEEAFAADALFQAYRQARTCMLDPNPKPYQGAQLTPNGAPGTAIRSAFGPHAAVLCKGSPKP